MTALEENPVSIAAAQLRGGGPMDLVVAVYDGVRVFLGHGDGTFDLPVFYPADTYNIGYSLVVGTFDGNASPDVVVASYYSSDIAFLPGAGDGTLGEPIPRSTSWATVSMTTGDFDSDGKLDLVTFHGQLRIPGRLPRRRGRTFGAPRAVHRGSVLAGSSIRRDSDGDGHPDVAVGSGSSSPFCLETGRAASRRHFSIPRT